MTGEKRTLAATYGVDPYTDFPPLKAKLDRLSEAAALGGLTVSGALLIVPGAAGIIVSNLSTAYKLNDIGLEDLARNFTAAQIMDLNRERLDKMGVDKEVTERLLANRNFTPIDLAAMVAALDSMQSVEDRQVFAAWAVTADARYFAYFVRRQAELMADDNRRHRNYRRLVSLAGYPFAATGDGRLHTLSPIDALAWTKETEYRFGDMSAARREIAPEARVDLRITGQATALARQKRKAQGWSWSERQKP